MFQPPYFDLCEEHCRCFRAAFVFARHLEKSTARPWNLIPSSLEIRSSSALSISGLRTVMGWNASSAMIASFSPVALCGLCVTRDVDARIRLTISALQAGN